MARGGAGPGGSRSSDAFPSPVGAASERRPVLARQPQSRPCPGQLAGARVKPRPSGPRGVAWAGPRLLGWRRPAGRKEASGIVRVPVALPSFACGAGGVRTRYHRAKDLLGLPTDVRLRPGSPEGACSVPAAVLPPSAGGIGSEGNGSWPGPAGNLPCVAHASDFSESAEMLLSALLMFLMDVLQAFFLKKASAPS